MSTGQFGDPTPLDELCDAAHEKEALVAMLVECRSALLVTDVPPHKEQCYIVDSADGCLRCVTAGRVRRLLERVR